MTDFDYRQLKLMIQKINDYRKGNIYLAWLISDIESLINILEDPNENWKARLRINWLALEEVYALALDDEKEHLDQEDIRIIDEALHQLETLIGDKLKTMKSPEDDC